MKQHSRKHIKPVNSILFLLICIFFPITMSAQKNYSANGSVKTTIKGSSNINEWDLNSEKGNCTLIFHENAAGEITAMSNLNFIMQVNTLKSKHGTTMDNNTYKAMESDKYPDIRFVATSGTVKSNGAGAYTITTPGKLSISSVTRDVILTATCRINADKSISLSGSYKLKTTDYNIKPISIMAGAIKTSSDVTIDYSMFLKPL